MLESSVDDIIAGMGTQMQSETYFLRHCSRSLSRSTSTGQRLSYNKVKVNEISQHEDSSAPCPGLIDRYSGHDKENFKEIILEHEVTFRHQVRELHRLYRRQRELMNAIQHNRFFYKFQKKAESSQSVIFSSFMSTECAKRTPDGSLLRSADSMIHRLDPLSNVKSTGRNYLDYLNEPLKFCSRSSLKSASSLSCCVDKLERQTFAANASSSFFLHKNTSQYSISEMKDQSLHIDHKTECRKKRKIFGVEIAEEVDELSLISSDTKYLHPKSNGVESGASPFLSVRESTNHLSLKVSPPQESHDAITSELSWLKLGSCLQNFEFVQGTDVHDALTCSNLQLKVGTATSLDILKGENDSTPSPDLFEFHDLSKCWQSVDSTQSKSRKRLEFDSESTKMPENVSQHFFKISEKAEIPSKDDMERPADSVNKEGPTQVVANSNFPKKSLSSHISGLRNHLDLNLPLVEEETPEAVVLPAAVVMIIRPEINLEAAAVIESEVEHGDTNLFDRSEKPYQSLIEEAAEALVVMSSAFTNVVANYDTCHLEKTSNCLHWFTDVICSHTNDEDGEIREIPHCKDWCCDEEAVPDGMDYFEFVTLKLKGVKQVTHCYSQSDMEHQKAAETEKSGRIMRRRGRQQKDFQKDVLPDLVSLAKQEVVEDLHTLEEMFRSTGKTWKSSLSRRNMVKHGRRGMKSRESLHAAEANPALPSKQKQTSKKRELRGKSFTGWGKRTRRLPRQRCSKIICSSI